jgi:hypothetical protein
VGILCGRVLGARGRTHEICGFDRDHDAEWADLERALGVPLPTTLSSKGDRHRYYWLPRGHGIRQQNGLVPDVDLRSDHGGYLVEPWEWDQPFDVAAVAELDTCAVEALRMLRGLHDSETAYGSDLPELGTLDDNQSEALIAAALDEWPSAGGHTGFHECCMAFGGTCRRAGIERDSTHDMITAIVQSAGSASPGTRVKAALDAWDRTERADPERPAYGRPALVKLLANEGTATLAAFDACRRPDPVVDAIVTRWADRRARANAPAPATAPSSPGVTPDDVLACLPAAARAHVLAAQEELRTPLELNLANTLGAMSCAVSGRLQVRMHASYVAHTCLWWCTVADPGELKSAAFNRAMQPIQSWEAEQTKLDADRYTRARVARSELEDQVKHLERERKRGFTAEDAPAPSDDLLRLHIKLAEPTPVPFRAIVGDVTSEKLADMLAQHGRLLCLSSDAGKIFSVLAGQYSGGSADLSVWLEAYDGRSAPVDRMGREAERPRHDCTTLACVLSTQASVLETVTGNQAMTGQGFVQRFCWVVCDSIAQRWAPGERVRPMPGDVSKAYGEMLDAMLALPAGSEAQLSPEAEAAYIAWRDELEARKCLDLGGEIKGWSGKHLERTARIASVLWAADGGKCPVTGEQFARAVVIGRWLTHHAVRVLGGQQDQLDEKLLACVSAAHAKHKRPVTVRDFAHKLPRALRRDAKARDARLANLTALGALVQVGVGKGWAPAWP